MSDTPEKIGQDGRERETNNGTNPKFPTTKIKYLRVHYGTRFANGWDGERMLAELLQETKFESLTEYLRYYGYLTD